MWEKLQRAWRIRELRKKILFVLGMLVIFRLTAHIPVPGVNAANLRVFLEGNQLLGILNLFSGGTTKNFSIVMLGVAPYITASIIFQLLAMVIPSLEELTKEGESGQEKLNMYTRWATPPLALLQAFGFIKLLSRSSQQIFTDLTPWRFVAIMITVTAGTMFLMWIGEIITEKKIGNGTSLLIFAGIISGLPTNIQNAVVNYNSSDLYTYIFFAILCVLTIVGVVIMSEGQRNIPVNYAKQVRGNRTYGGASTHLPLRVNSAGVIPIIFAVSLITFPPIVARFFTNGTGRLAHLANFTINFFNNQTIHAILYFVLVFGFTYFYTAVVFNPQKIAENLQRQGGFIPGIRPGKETEMYLARVMNRLVFGGALFLAVLAVLPLTVQLFTGSQLLVIGGTSLLIVVSVAIESAKQIESQLTMYEYDRV